ncbi:hypothetical protein ACS0TY_029494 [Phlomoides rotata]
MEFLLFLLVFIVPAAAAQDAFIGVNIGTNTPNPTQVATLLKAHNIHHVRLYNADSNMLLALANTGIAVAVSLPNDQIAPISLSNSTAAKWVSHNIVPHHPTTNITTICINSNLLTPLLLNALKNIHLALIASNLGNKIKVSTPFPSTIILNSFPPSQAFFNRSLNHILLPTLKFLQSINSYFMINIHPYLDYVQSNRTMPLDYALFKPLPTNKAAQDTNTHLHYSSFFDSMIDSAYSAMADLNITNLPIMVMESGWPSKGGADEPDANPENARTYNTNLVKHVLNNTGTPRHPGIAVSTYIYELYNEDTKSGPLSGKDWGLFDMNGDPVYDLQLSAAVVANGTSNQTYCTAKTGAEASTLQAALDWACGAGKVDCSPLMQGKPCYEPDTLFDHASYAFDIYYNLMGKAPGSCDFNGVATITSISPSHGSCTFSQRLEL